MDDFFTQRTPQTERHGVVPERQQALTKRSFTAAAFDLLRGDRRPAFLTAGSSAAGVVAAGAVVGASLVLTTGLRGTSAEEPALWVAAVLGLLAWNCVTVFGAAMVCLAVGHALDGDRWTVRQVWGEAWARRGALLAWAALSTCVGLALRLLERLGVFGWVARLVGEAAWAVVTVFAIPALVHQQQGPLTTVRSSARTLTARFGDNATNLVRLGAVAFIVTLSACVPVVVGLTLLLAGGPMAVAGVVIAAAGLMLVVACAAYFEAVSMALRTMLYREAHGLAAPWNGQVPGAGA